MRGLSSVLSKLYGLKEAEEMARGVLKTSRALYGNEHTTTQMTLVGLAGLLLEQGKREEAEIVLKQMVSRHQTSDDLPSQNQERLDCLSALANVLRMQGEYQEAEEIGISVLTALESSRGANHSTTIVFVGIYAETLYRLGKLDQAEEMVVRALNGQRRLHGNGQRHILLNL